MATPKRHRKQWTPKEKAKLVQLINGNTPTRVIALKMERTENAIRSKVQDMNQSLAPWNQSPYNRKP